MVGSLNPGPETVIQLFHGERLFGIEIGQELIAQSAEVTLDFAAAFGLIGRCVNDQDAKRGGDAGQLGGVKHFAIIDIETDGDAAGRGPAWDDAYIPNRVMRGARDYLPPAALPGADLSSMVPGH